VWLSLSPEERVLWAWTVLYKPTVVVTEWIGLFQPVRKAYSITTTVEIRKRRYSSEGQSQIFLKFFSFLVSGSILQSYGTFGFGQRHSAVWEETRRCPAFAWYVLFSFIVQNCFSLKLLKLLPPDVRCLHKNATNLICTGELTETKERRGEREGHPHPRCRNLVVLCVI